MVIIVWTIHIIIIELITFLLPKQIKVLDFCMEHALTLASQFSLKTTRNSVMKVAMITYMNFPKVDMEDMLH